MPDTPAQRYGVLLDRLINSGQWERAAQVARDWLAEDPLSVPAHRARAQALVNLERYDAVAGHVERVLAGEPYDGFAHRLASIACFARKDFTAADDHIQQAIALQPQVAMHWYHLAWMRYQHGAHEAAARYGQRALALAPQSADTINLLALCQPSDGKTRLAQYQRALALDPENAMVHNNVGAYYLHAENNPGRALESFRQALRLDPTNATAQKNLFTALRSCDTIYKVLSWPRVFSPFLWLRPGRWGWRTVLRYVWLAAFGYTVIPFLLCGYGLWLLAGLPLLKGYEYLTIRDLRARAGVPGARRGGLWGFWRWPFAVRFALYFLGVTLFWGGGGWLCRDVPPIHALAALGGLALVVFCVNLLWRLSRSSHRRFRNWRGERRFRRRMEAAAPAGLGPDLQPPPLPRIQPTRPPPLSKP